MKYKGGYNYQLTEDYEAETGIDFVEENGIWYATLGHLKVALPGYDGQFVNHVYIRLTRKGRVFIKCGYAWDGITDWFDWYIFMRGSLEHDGYYQLIREGILPASFKDIADYRFKIVILEDGTPPTLASIAHTAVCKFGGIDFKSRL